MPFQNSFRNIERPDGLEAETTRSFIFSTLHNA